MTKDINLKSIEINSFRGIKNYDLNFYDPEKNKYKSMIFCGANGTGKSSFVNAFEYLFTGKIESLKGTSTINHDKSIIHRDSLKDDLYVKAQIGDFEISRSFKDGFQYPDELKELVDDFENGSFILNRKKLLLFIESRPKQRYETIANLINFNQYDDIENSLRKCEKSFKNDLKAKEEELSDNEMEITEIYNCDIGEVYEKTNDILKENDFELITEDSDLKEYIKEHSIENENLDELEEIDISKINEKYLSQLNVYEKITLNELKSSNTLLKLLNNSIDYINDESPDTCPICKNKIENTKVLRYISAKRSELEKNSNALLNWQKENDVLIRQIQELNYKLKDYDLNNLINDLKELSNFNINISQMDRDILTNIDNEINELKAKYTKQDYDLKNAGEVIYKLSERQKLLKEKEKVEKQHEIAQISYDTFKELKKTKIEEILEEIITYVDKYYSFIHEDDEIHSPEINVDKSTALTLKLIFGDEKNDPRSYSSEGHIDSLGLCIFLAFAKVFNKYKFIILDDIIATVDMAHKERVVRLLFEEFEDYTFIITTHNKLWFEQLQNMSQMYDQDRYAFENIISWSEKEGPQLYPYVSQEERIEQYIENNDVFAAGNGIRRYFEFILDGVVRNNGIKMPLKKHYTVNDYYSQVRSQLKSMFKKTEFKEYYNAVFDEIDKTSYMGNLMSHNNEANYYLDISEIIKFKEAVFNFRDSVTCHDPKHHNKFLRFNKEKKIGICTSKKCDDIFKF
ncbi:AAA family ATPase [Methanobrevibacter millerae]|uniref:RecF/RecN/SMC N terminal domain-containing protein n=1 Tax=Methanobrevibacter millerae TaxID=230361 RepID=A0A1G5WGX3_9EURY|nr:AAA family ATPase [Methanobrevibacter millerae]SDA57323.1 hypothetical protein SAMN02910315_01403 [Methanobrevibacter millerae]